MVADCASPRPSAMLAKGLDLAVPDQTKAVLPAESAKRHQAVENLEALLNDAVDADHSGSDRLDSEQSLFKLGALWPGRAVTVESEIDSAPTWTEVMVAFGQEIQRIRQAQGLSLEQIRFKTQVPVYQLEALESGAVDRLPEEIFVRGFVNRICMQLGTEGKALLAQLPDSHSRPQEILADWQQLGGAGGLSSQFVALRSVHLYLGYATLLAGATGGLAWSFQETAQVSQSDILPQPAQKIYSQAKLNPLQKMSQLTSGVDIAPPEVMMPESSDLFEP